MFLLLVRSANYQTLKSQILGLGNRVIIARKWPQSPFLKREQVFARDHWPLFRPQIDQKWNPVQRLETGKQR